MGNPDFTSYEDAVKELNRFKWLVKMTVIEKATSKQFMVSAIDIHPNTWFDKNGVEQQVGFDVRIYFVGAMSFERSTELVKRYTTPQKI